MIPIYRSSITPCALGNSLDDELCNVLARRAIIPPLGKLSDHISAILPDGSEVESIAARIERQNDIELLDQHGSRLVDGANDILPSLREFLQDTNDRESALTVKPTRWYVQKEQQIWSSSKFDSNRKTLLLLHAEGTDNSVLEEVEFKKDHKFIHVFDLLGLWDTIQLPEDRGEFHSFADGLGRIVKIRLFTISGPTLEFNTEGTAIHLDFASNNTNLVTLKERIEKSSPRKTISSKPPVQEFRASTHFPAPEAPMRATIIPGLA